nr:hypothetical protein GCM10020093_034650 [Planobispora longispora]
MLDVRRLRLLRELSHRGTIAAVAEALMFTPSAVSQQLSALEREAGVALLERTGRRVALTPAGIALVGHAEAVLERLEQAAAELASARADLSGTVRIGAFPTATRTILPAALAALAREHPALEPMVDEIDPAEVAPACAPATWTWPWSTSTTSSPPSPTSPWTLSPARRAHVPRHPGLPTPPSPPRTPPAAPRPRGGRRSRLRGRGRGRRRAGASRSSAAGTSPGSSPLRARSATR